MKSHRRSLLRLIVGGSALPTLSWGALTEYAYALDYPTRPVHIIVGFPAGTSSDITSSQFPDLLSGQVQITFNPLPSSLDFIRAGKLRGLAVTSAMRSGALPSLSPLGEYLPGYEATAWFGIGAPKATPSPVVDRLNKEVNAALADPQFKTRLIDLGGAPMPLSIAEFSNFIATETGKWATVVNFSGAKA